MSWVDVASQSLPDNPANPAHDTAPERDSDAWDAAGILIFATSVLGLGGNGVLVLLRVFSG